MEFQALCFTCTSHRSSLLIRFITGFYGTFHFPGKKAGKLDDASLPALEFLKSCLVAQTVKNPPAMQET